MLTTFWSEPVSTLWMNSKGGQRDGWIKLTDGLPTSYSRIHPVDCARALRE